jgi:hypothetical protein
MTTWVKQSKCTDEILRSLNYFECCILYLMLFDFWICPSLTVPHVFVWLLVVGISSVTVPVGRDLGGQMAEIRDFENQLIEFRDSNSEYQGAWRVNTYSRTQLYLCLVLQEEYNYMFRPCMWAIFKLWWDFDISYTWMRGVLLKSPEWRGGGVWF